MKFFIPIKRATLLIPSGPANDPNRLHLFILLTDPITEEKLVLLCPVSTLYPDKWHDPTCILDNTDHEFIQHRSFVNYSKARIITAAKLDNGVKNNLFKAKATVSEEVYVRICEGLFASRFTTLEVKTFLSTPV